MGTRATRFPPPSSSDSACQGSQTRVQDWKSESLCGFVLEAATVRREQALAEAITYPPRYCAACRDRALGFTALSRPAPEAGVDVGSAAVLGSQT